MLEVCLNGTRGAHDRVPVTLAQIAKAAEDAVAAGADAVHVHPRGDQGRQTLDGYLVALTVEAVRDACPGVPVGVTTIASVAPDPAERLAMVRTWPSPDEGGPDFASVNWHEPGAVDVARALRTRHIGVEAGLWSPTAAASFVGTHWPWQVLRVLVETMPGHSPGGFGPWAAERILSALGSQPAPVLVHGESVWTWPVLRWAQQNGYDTRIGLEDTLFDESGLRAVDNAALVRTALAGR